MENNTPITDSLIKYQPNESGGGLYHILDIDKVRKLEKENFALQTEVKSLRKDKERLDTAERHAGDIDMKLKPIAGLLMSDVWICEGSNIRSALDKLKSGIDSAIKQQKESGKV